MTPAETPPSAASPPRADPCVRCGAFDVTGPAAEIGFRLCRPCFEAAPASAVEALAGMRRARLALVVAAIAPALPFAALVALRIAVPDAGVLAPHVSRLALDVLLALSYGALAVYLGMVIALLIRLLRRAVRLFEDPGGVPVEALRRTAAAPSIVAVLGFFEAEAENARVRRLEPAVLGVTPRGLILLSANVRLALSRGAVTLDLARLPWQWLRIEAAGRAKRIFAIPHGGSSVLPGRKAARLLGEIRALDATPAASGSQPAAPPAS